MYGKGTGLIYHKLDHLLQLKKVLSSGGQERWGEGYCGGGESESGIELDLIWLMCLRA